MLLRAASLVPCLCLSLGLQAYDPRPDLEEGRYLKALWDAEARLKADPSDALAMAARSQALSSLMRFSEALPLAEKALKLKPGLADALLARGMARAGAAIQQRNLGSLFKAGPAMDDLEAATRADPGLAQAWMTRGMALQQAPGILGGSRVRALECAAQLRRLRPAKGDLLQGMILSMDNRWKEAEPYFGRALALAPGDAEVVYGYLEALGSRETRKALGEGAQRARLATEARRLLPGVARKGRGVEAVSQALLDAGQGEEAWQVAKAALGQADAPSLIRLQLGKIAAKSGLHREEGLAYLDQVFKEALEGGSGGYPAAYWRRGEILRDLGRKEEARAAARGTLYLDPKHKGATKLLEELEEKEN